MKFEKPFTDFSGKLNSLEFQKANQKCAKLCFPRGFPQTIFMTRDSMGPNGSWICFRTAFLATRCTRGFVLIGIIWSDPSKGLKKFQEALTEEKLRVIHQRIFVDAGRCDKSAVAGCFERRVLIWRFSFCLRKQEWASTMGVFRIIKSWRLRH